MNPKKEDHSPHTTTTPLARSSKSSKLFRETFSIIILSLIFLIVLPLGLSNYWLNSLGRFSGLAITALGIDLIWGYTGILSLGHGIFFTLGGYAIAMYLKLQSIPAGTSNIPDFMEQVGIKELPWFWQPFHSPIFTLLAIIIIPAIIGALLGYLLFRNRIRGIYFSILTQITTIIFFYFFNNQLTLLNGNKGLTNFTTLLGIDLKSPPALLFFYSISIVFLVFGYGICRWLTSGRFGKLLIAIKEDEDRTRFSGYNPTSFKLLVFVVSAALAGIGGALYTIQTGLASPQTMDLPFSIELILGVALGGQQTLIGPIIGTLILYLAKTFINQNLPAFWLFFQGGLLLLVIMVIPTGLIGLWRNQFSSSTNNNISSPNNHELVTYPKIELEPEPISKNAPNSIDSKSDTKF